MSAKRQLATLMRGCEALRPSTRCENSVAVADCDCPTEREAWSRKKMGREASRVGTAQVKPVLLKGAGAAQSNQEEDVV